MYPPTTSESSTGDSSSESSAGPSRKRCRSPTAIVTSSIHASRDLVPSHADLLPSRKRFRDSISPEDSVEEDIDTDVLADIEADATVVEPTRLQDAVRIANNLMEQNLKRYAVKNAENKRRFDNNQKDNRVQQPPYKRQNVGGQSVARAYTAGNNEKRGYVGPLPYCNKCKLHHKGPCTVKCKKCNKVRHMTRDCMNDVATTATQRSLVVNHRVLTCFECERQGHYRNECPKLKNLSRGNKAGKRPMKLEGRNMCWEEEKLNLIPMSLRQNHYAVIVCDEKIVRIPYGNEVLIVQGDRSGKEKKSRLSIISCTKTQKYIKKGCQIFLAQVTKKGTKDKSKEKRIEDVPIIRDFPEVFPKDFPGLPPTRQVEFQIDLVLGAALVARAPYRLAPSELQELSTQLQNFLTKGS
ncbi:putative reverse transcriptase domain-containing protein [Tanacetum coccineum]